MKNTATFGWLFLCAVYCRQLTHSLHCMYMKYSLLSLSILLLSYQLWAQPLDVDTTTGVTAPSNVSSDYQQLTRHLTEGVMDDQLKANILFNWVTNNIQYDVKASRDPKKQNPTIEEVLKTKSTVANGYIKLYVAMCRYAGLEAVAVDGYYKDRKFTKGDKLYIPRDGWCAVKMNGVWEIVDPVSGSGYITHQPGWLMRQLSKLSKNEVMYSDKPEFEKDYDPKMFMIDPVKHREQRLAADPYWQLVGETMPLSVFLAGDSAVKAFNAVHNRRIKNSPQLIKVSKQTFEERILDAADRIHQFNNNYWLELARKEKLLAANTIAQYSGPYANLTDISKAAFIEGKAHLVKAGEYIDSQQAPVQQYYAELKRNNVEKNKLAKHRMRDLRVAVKRVMSQCNIRRSTAERRQESLDSKVERNNGYIAELDTARLQQIEPISMLRDKDNPMMMTLLDSIDAKDTRIKNIERDLDDSYEELARLDADKDEYLTKYAKYVGIADSFIQQEAYARARLQDSYDEDVTSLVQQHHIAWDTNAMHYQNLLFTAFDTLLDRFITIERTHNDQFRWYRSITRDMEQYYRMTGGSDEFKQLYVNVTKRYMAGLYQFKSLLESMGGFYTNSIDALKKINEYYEEEQELFEYMEKVENERKDIEDNQIEEDKTYDEQELEQLEKENQQAIKDIEATIKKHDK